MLVCIRDAQETVCVCEWGGGNDCGVGVVSMFDIFYVKKGIGLSLNSKIQYLFVLVVVGILKIWYEVLIVDC